MKRLVILLVILIIAGAASIYLLENHADLQADLPTSYLLTDEGAVPDQEAAEAALRVEFSRKDAFSSEDITVELTCRDPDAMIYYTDDGNDPDRNSKIYTEPIQLRAQSYEKCTTIKAFAADGDITGGTSVKSYIVGTNMTKRFSRDTLVFVLSSDEYNLYDYYYGVATEGYLRDEFIHSDAFPGGDLKPTDPANYNIRGRESERPMYVEVFTSDGKQLISQAAGGRVVGGYSRGEAQKSWRLIARNLYSEGDGKFRYPFFNDAADAEGNFLTRYDRITLRNGANDREFAGIRDELSMTLAAQMGFPDTQAVTPAAVYLNGKYYGYAWLHEAYSTDYLESVYGGNKDNFRIVGSKELEPESDDPEDERAVADWEYVIGLAKKGFEDDAVYEEFCSLVDMDNLVLYYAMQLYIDNKDWPGNNFKVWRYYPEPGESAESEYLDGKWRFLFFDAEFAWGLYNKGFRDDTVHSVLIGTHMQGTSYILSALLSRPDTREKFADTVCELEGYAFSMDNVEKVLDDLIKKSDHEQMHALKAGKISSWANVFTFDNSRKQIRDFAAYRPINFNKNLAKTLEIKKTQYTVNLETPSGALVHLGAISLGKGESVSVKYFDEYSAYLSAEPYEGFAIDHWSVNGTPVYEDSLKLDRSMADEDKKEINVSLFLKRVPAEGKVIVSELFTAGDADWIEIHNSGGAPVSLRGMHLSDDKDELDRFRISDLIVPADGRVLITLKNNNSSMALMHTQTNFSLKPGETLYFSDQDCNIISAVPVLALNIGQSLSAGVDGKYHIGPVTQLKDNIQR